MSLADALQEECDSAVRLLNGPGRNTLVVAVAVLYDDKGDPSITFATATGVNDDDVDNLTINFGIGLSEALALVLKDTK